MIILLSPAKTIREQIDFSPKKTTDPLFLEEAGYLMQGLKKIPLDELKKLMSVSDNLALKTLQMIEGWTREPGAILPAALAFDGEAYRGLKANEFSKDELDFAQKHLVILSGLYGALRPLDRIAPYRLEMGTKWGPGDHSNLYQFWGDRISETINRTANGLIINLASAEYSKVIDLKSFKGQVIVPVFKEYKNGTYQTVMMYAKHGRGSMTRYIIKNRITDPENIKGFDTDGYGFDANLSNDNEWVFTR